MLWLFANFPFRPDNLTETIAVMRLEALIASSHSFIAGCQQLPLGKPVGAPATDEAEHFIRCPACGAWIHCRDLACVFEHEGSLPHPAQDQLQ